MLIYSKKYFVILQNKYYSSIYKSIIITSLIWFNIALTDAETTLQQRWYNVVSTLWNVVLTLFQRRTLTLYQHYITLKIRRRILRHFQRRTNVISSLIQKFDPTLKYWLGRNVGPNFRTPFLPSKISTQRLVPPDASSVLFPLFINDKIWL